MRGFSPKAVALGVAVLAGWFLLGVLSQTPASSPKPGNDGFTRPKPTRPIRPEIPFADRRGDDRVFLEQADSLYTLPTYPGEREKQIVKGNVKFRQEGMFMFCDSAYFYPQENSMDAFGHVKMEQGDTLFAYSDKIYYDGNIRLARLRNGPSQAKVILENRDVVLTTDSLDYDMVRELGYYTTGGHIRDAVNDLTSVRGQYSPATKEALFEKNVVLVNREDDFTMRTEELLYNTDTHIAEISTATRIEGRNDVIETTQGWYNTITDEAELTNRSVIFHTDSTGNVTTLEGDSIIYDKATHISRAYMFGSASKLPRPMVITDTARKATLIGGYGEYNDSSQTAFATHYPLLLEYSRPDTLFLRADTIWSLMEKVKVKDPVALQDSIAQSMLKKLKRDSLALLDSVALLDTVAYAAALAAIDEIALVDSVPLVDQDFHMAKAYRRARFFNQTMQGVADSLTFREADSLMYMDRKPVVWSDNRQVNGNRIIVHFNDSEPDWALLPDHAIAAEHVEDDFYSQLSARKMKAFFKNQELERLEADGNVMTIFLPMEQDSTYNKLINAESSYLTLDMKGQDMEKLKMWPEVSGTVIPTFMVKPADKYLAGFQWLEMIRPRREWYGDSWRWSDELGDVSDELEQYFNEPTAQ